MSGLENKGGETNVLFASLVAFIREATGSRPPGLGRRHPDVILPAKQTPLRSRHSQRAAWAWAWALLARLPDLLPSPNPNHSNATTGGRWVYLLRLFNTEHNGYKRSFSVFLFGQTTVLVTRTSTNQPGSQWGLA